MQAIRENTKYPRGLPSIRTLDDRDLRGFNIASLSSKSKTCDIGKSSFVGLGFRV